MCVVMQFIIRNSHLFLKLSLYYISRSFGKNIGCTDVEAMAECLKTKSTMQIVNASVLNTAIHFSPVIDGKFLPGENIETVAFDENLSKVLHCSQRIKSLQFIRLYNNICY
jgi:hypothetical protein